MSGMLNYLKNQKSFQQIINEVARDTAQLVTGIAESARASLIASITEEKDCPTIVFTSNLHQANLLFSDLQELYPKDNIYVYNVNDMIHTQLSIASPEEQAERIETLEFLLTEKPGIILIPVAGARRLLPPKSAYQKAHLEIEVGNDVELEELTSQLIGIGYV